MYLWINIYFLKEYLNGNRPAFDNDSMWDKIQLYDGTIQHFFDQNDLLALQSPLKLMMIQNTVVWQKYFSLF